MDGNDLVGRTYEFEDGNSITVVQVKMRDGNIPHVTYSTKIGPGIPRNLQLPLGEFLNLYGHLFGIKSDDIPN